MNEKIPTLRRRLADLQMETTRVEGAQEAAKAERKRLEEEAIALRFSSNPKELIEEATQILTDAEEVVEDLEQELKTLVSDTTQPA